MGVSPQRLVSCGRNRAVSLERQIVNICIELEPLFPAQPRTSSTGPLCPVPTAHKGDVASCGPILVPAQVCLLGSRASCTTVGAGRYKNQARRPLPCPFSQSSQQPDNRSSYLLLDFHPQTNITNIRRTIFKMGKQSFIVSSCPSPRPPSGSGPLRRQYLLTLVITGQPREVLHQGAGRSVRYLQQHYRHPSRTGQLSKNIQRGQGSRGQGLDRDQQIHSNYQGLRVCYIMKLPAACLDMSTDCVLVSRRRFLMVRSVRRRPRLTASRESRTLRRMGP